MDHPYRQIDVPADAPFELQPSPGPGNRGWGAFATRPIKRNDLILRETPLFVLTGPPSSVTDAAIKEAVGKLTAAQKRQFHCLRNNSNTNFVSLRACFSQNKFRMPGSDASERYGLFVVSSRFNHSCVPNAKVPGSRDIRTYHEMYAVKDILAGEEITFCYTSQYHVSSYFDRLIGLGFMCNCKACQPGTLFYRLSDPRRRLLRGMHFLLRGQDRGMPVEVTWDMTPIIADPVLRQAAEKGDIPLSSRVIYLILLVFLMEQEELLNDFELRYHSPMLNFFLGAFSNPEHIKIAQAVMRQSTWLGKLQVAFWLYGREDNNDRNVSAIVKGRGMYP